jgi:hypothetical protein
MRRARLLHRERLTLERLNPKPGRLVEGVALAILLVLFVVLAVWLALFNWV